MKKIDIIRKEGLDPQTHERVDKTVESLFGENYINLPSPTKIKHITDGLLSGGTRLYEMQGGAVLYSEALSTRVEYAANIILIGFDENSEAYQKLKRSLEEIASQNPQGVDKEIRDYLGSSQGLMSSKEFREFVEEFAAKRKLAKPDSRSTVEPVK